MKFKKLLIIASVLLFLFILTFIKNTIQKKRSSQEQSLIVSDDLTKGLNASFIAKTIIYKGDNEKNKIVLSKNSAGEWALENKFGIKAKKEFIDGLIKDLVDLKGEVRAETKSVFSDFLINNSEGVHIVFEADAEKVLKHLVFGLSRPNWGKNFVRLQESEKVVLIKKDILSRLGIYDKGAELDNKNFADLKMFSFDSKAVRKIELNAKKAAVVLIKKDEPDRNAPVVWRLIGARLKEEIDTAKVDEFLRNISNMSALDAVDPAQQGIYGFDAAFLNVILEGPEAAKLAQIEVGAYLPAEKVYYVLILPQNQTFKVQESFIQNLTKDKTYFLKTKDTKNNKPR